LDKSKKVEIILKTFEQKIFRRIYGPIYKHAWWIIHCNNEMYDLFKDINVVHARNSKDWNGLHMSALMD